MASADIGLIGLGVMGQNLALNIADKGYQVAAYEREAVLRQQFIAAISDSSLAATISCHSDLTDWLAALKSPRAILLMIKAGVPVDEQLAALQPLLTAGDLIIDGGNSHYLDTAKRYQAMQSAGLYYLGIGVSGGAYGARHGPALMVGGSEQGYQQVDGLLAAIAASVNEQKCCAYLGAAGAGHFVKMMHNGIEYADMQLIAEIYALLRALNVSYPDMQALFNEWNKGELNSYLLEITATILTASDAESGLPMVEMILDSAEQKGTGQWAVHAALVLGVPAPTISEAVFARSISALKEERIVAERLLHIDTLQRPANELIDALPSALLAAKVCTYAQGFAVLKAASDHYQWQLPFTTISSIWRGGCIIQARILNAISEAFERNEALYNLLLDPYFQVILQNHHLALRRVVATAAALGVATPALSSALSYFDSYRTSRLPANLIQAQRDYFGAHNYQRIDKQGYFHTDWQALEA